MGNKNNRKQNNEMYAYYNFILNDITQGKLKKKSKKEDEDFQDKVKIRNLKKWVGISSKL